MHDLQLGCKGVQRPIGQVFMPQPAHLQSSSACCQLLGSANEETPGNVNRYQMVSSEGILAKKDQTGTMLVLL